jgi:AraC family transcriptional regulator of adaptative response / DNA-3-methyladenine glycosylase II
VGILLGPERSRRLHGQGGRGACQDGPSLVDQERLRVGFRPCLRCRPETAPFSSAWIGSRATVERALRLIVEEGALDQEGATVERLAQRLGVGSRQLTRLFARYLQASPSKVARTARVQRAKRLLDETSLPMTEIAMRAGFGSLRRFNSVFAEVYGRAPTEIRRKRSSGAVVLP